MKPLTLLALGAFFIIFSACQQKTEDTDAREQYLGTWTGTVTIIVPSQSINRTDVDKEVVTKTANRRNKITLTSQPDTTGYITTTVNGSSITFDPVAVEDGIENGIRGGTGTINGKTLTASGTLKYLSREGTPHDGTWSATWSKE